jgi:hypothetical protein
VASLAAVVAGSSNNLQTSRKDQKTVADIRHTTAAAVVLQGLVHDFGLVYGVDDVNSLCVIREEEVAAEH